MSSRDFSHSERCEGETIITQICQYMLGRKRAKTNELPKCDEQTGQTYWSKGTGYGTDLYPPAGSGQAAWSAQLDLEQWLVKQRDEEDHVAGLLDKLSDMIESDSSRALESVTVSSKLVPRGLYDNLRTSGLIPAAASHLINDSALDMSRHIRLYSAIVRVINAVATSEELRDLLQEPITAQHSDNLTSLLDSVSECLAKYHSRLKLSGISASSTFDADDQENGLAKLAKQLMDTSKLLPQFKPKNESPISLSEVSQINRVGLYEKTMKDMQFDTYRMLDTSTNPLRFLLSHHYDLQICNGITEYGNSARHRRLAQEMVTLSTSLPLSASSSVFVRFDEKRMDVMKVLITGPVDTPYMNGCFEFDVYFPSDYPSSPPLINLQTTGNQQVRFNPNLYNNGEVCLSILNTWDGRPEERWNAMTSSILQVLVSIQSMVFVSEPYFNEPGYEVSHGTAHGTNNCREYNSSIRQATVKFAMLEMLKNPPACFKDVIRQHFWIKREEIKHQIEIWMNETNIAMHYHQLMIELQQIQFPEVLS